MLADLDFVLRRQFARKGLLFIIAQKFAMLDGCKRFRCVQARFIALHACDVERFPVCGFAAQDTGLTGASSVSRQDSASDSMDFDTSSIWFSKSPP